MPDSDTSTTPKPALSGGAHVPASVSNEDKAALLAKARAFLASPAVLSHDGTTRRQFLLEKGLKNEEIDQIISEVPPPIPPRTYPSPPPSKLPIILYATAKLLTLLSGVSVVGVAMYFIYVYPRLAASLGARAKLAAYQTSLLKRLRGVSEETRSIQRSHTVHPIKVATPEKSQGRETIVEPPSEAPEEPATETSEADRVSGNESTEKPTKSEYEALNMALTTLRDSLPRRKATYATTLQDLTDMTALITSKMYAPKVHTALEGEVRQEIRAAKGLLLNRKTFIGHKPSTS